MNKRIATTGALAAVLSGAMMMFALPAFASTPTAAPTHAAPMAHRSSTAPASGSKLGRGNGKVDPADLAAGFATLNLTSYPMTETSHSIDGQFNGPEPYDGTTTSPGSTSTWGIVYWPDRINTADIRYELNDQWHTHFEVESTVDGSIAVNDGETDRGFYSHYTPVVSQRPDGSEWLTIEAAGQHVYNLTGVQAEQEYQMLKTLGNGGEVAYNFKQTGYQHNVLSAPQLAGSPQQNLNDPLPTNNSFTTSDSVATTTTWSVSATVGADIAGIVKVEASASYGQSYAEDHTVSSTESLPIAQGYAGWFTVQNPVDRVTGDFTITVGNDTWNLTDVGFDLPLSGAGYAPMYTAQVAKIGSPNVPSIVRN